MCGNRKVTFRYFIILAKAEKKEPAEIKGDKKVMVCYRAVIKTEVTEK